MTDNYTSCHVCDEAATTACLFVKHGRGRRGRRLSLRGSGRVNKSGPSCTAAPAGSLDAGVAGVQSMSCTFEISALLWCKSKSDMIDDDLPLWMRQRSYLSSVIFCFWKVSGRIYRCRAKLELVLSRFTIDLWSDVFVFSNVWTLIQKNTFLKPNPWVCVVQSLLLWLRVCCFKCREKAFLYFGYVIDCLNSDWDSKKDLSCVCSVFERGLM